MDGSAKTLREQLRRVGEAKARSRAEDDAEHLALPIGERLRRGMELGDQALRAFPPGNDRTDDEAETWARVSARLRRTGRGGA
ncbi:hypothetical protein L6R50_05540 [Myxococcota bacterium]|nr:hypothetical protein [Myxococcota bacterium]